MRVVSQIPNAITCGNLLAGCVGIVQILEGELVAGSVCVAIAAVLDFLDGFVARLLKVSSPIGKELDSLADVVTFGVLPGMVVFMLMASNLGLPKYQAVTTFNLAWVAMLIPIFSAYRLAVFNTDTRQSDQFIGVPTPANAIFFASFPLVMAFSGGSFMAKQIESPLWLTLVTVIFSYLLVSPLPLIALKFKSLDWASNRFRFILIGTSVLLPLFFSWPGIPLAIIAYIVLSAVAKITQL